jgi:hypothetical protein
MKSIAIAWAWFSAFLLNALVSLVSRRVPTTGRQTWLDTGPGYADAPRRFQRRVGYGTQIAFDDFFRPLNLSPIENVAGKCRLHKPG